MINQGLRTREEQDALHTRGRTKLSIGKRDIVIMAKDGHTYHNSGLAFDTVGLRQGRPGLRPSRLSPGRRTNPV